MNRRMVLPFLEGDVVLDYPSAISAEDLEDVELWLDLVLRSMRRQAAQRCASETHQAEGPPTDARSPTPTDTTPVPEQV